MLDALIFLIFRILSWLFSKTDEYIGSYGYDAGCVCAVCLGKV